MPGPHTPDRPTSEEIRVALDRVLQSDAFRTSPQLVAFLRFVVEATLSGHSDRIKGYTIAVEALGRSEDFDPQSDPIVRVEAARLRRALDRYYAETETAETVLIELPRGSYVPLFRARQAPPPRPRLGEAIRDRAAALQGSELVLFGLLAGVVAYALIDAAILNQWSSAPDISATATIDTAREQRAPARAGSGLPLVSVQRPDVIGAPVLERSVLDGVAIKLRDALARFDEIDVAADMPAPQATEGAASSRPSPRSDYSITTTAESRRDGALALTVRLNDVRDGTLAWTRSFNAMHLDDLAAGRDEIVRRAAATLAAPYGVIHARELARRGGADADPRYRCLVEAMEFRRTNDPAQLPHLRACLERSVAVEAGFANGFALLALVNLREYYEVNFRGSAAPDDGSAERLRAAEQAAQRAVDLKPQSARAHQARMSALFARGEVAAALAQGETAVALNPYDVSVLVAYGLRLVATSDVAKATALLNQAAAYSAVNPPILDFALFACDYLRGDDAGVAYRAGLLTSDTYPPALLAQALAAIRAGDRARARRAVAQLTGLYPAWGSDVRGKLARFIPAPAIVDRVVRDLAEAGLSAVQ